MAILIRNQGLALNDPSTRLARNERVSPLGRPFDNGEPRDADYTLL